MGTVFGVALIALSLLMLVGFLRSDVEAGTPAAIAALLVTVAVPAAAGIGLLTRRFRRTGQLAQRREALRQQTLDAEILRLAAERQGRLTAVEVATEFALPPEKAKELLESFMIRELADIQVTDSGVLVYTFHDVMHLGEKSRAKGVLDA